MASGKKKSAKKQAEGFFTPFKGLQRPASPPASRPAAPPPAPSTARAPAPPSADERLFEEAMRGVQPLPDAQRRRRALPETTAAPSQRREAKALLGEDALARADLADLVAPGGAFTIDEVGEAVSGRAPGIDRRMLQRLRAGDYPVEAEHDLHGQTREQAAGTLERFVASARLAGKRCVLVIHGRGTGSGPEGPVLKSAATEWLTHGRIGRHVMAFASAPPDRGGTGATLVLLRRRNHP
jgi:DNA-nicking Smr family endonuclease